MMKELKHFSVRELNRISRNKEIYCYGCGKIFYDIINTYAKEPFVKKITGLIDGNINFCGKSVRINNKDIMIDGPDKIKQLCSNKSLILITTNRYAEVFDRISKIKDKNVVCSKYPKMYYAYTGVLLRIFSCFPDKKSMLFHYGNEPHESAISIIDYLHKTGIEKKYKVVLLTEKEGLYQRFADKHICISKESITGKCNVKEVVRYCFYYGRAKYLFYENESIKKYGNGQRLIYLNHGTIPFKNVKDVLKQTEDLDYAVCPSEKCSQIYLEQYGVPVEKQLYFMQPRVSLLFHGRENVEKYLQSNGKQIIIWLPTFRRLKGSERIDSNSTNALSVISQEKDMARLNDFLKKHQQILLIKQHPCEKGRLSISDKYENIKIIDDKALEGADVILQELLGATNALITDYSGIMFEYLFLNKPVAFVVKDIEEYHRGFCFEKPFDYMPGHKIETLTDFIQFLKDVYNGKDDYVSQRLALREKFFADTDPQKGAEYMVKFMRTEHAKDV